MNTPPLGVSILGVGEGVGWVVFEGFFLWGREKK